MAFSEAASPTRYKVLGSDTGSDFKSTACTSVKIAVLAPTPKVYTAFWQVPDNSEVVQLRAKWPNSDTDSAEDAMHLS